LLEVYVNFSLPFVLILSVYIYCLATKQHKVFGSAIRGQMSFSNTK